MAKKTKGNSAPKSTINIGEKDKGILAPTPDTKAQVKIDRELSIIAEASGEKLDAFKTFKVYKKHEVMRILGLSNVRVYNLLKQESIMKDQEGWYQASALRALVKKRVKKQQEKEGIEKKLKV